MAGTVTESMLTPAQQRRGYWLRTLRTWHWISSAICLIGMTGFAITGITLNHAGSIETTPKTIHAEARLPTPLQRELRQASGRAPLPAAVAAWLETRFELSIAARAADWSSDEVYVSMPRPGGDAWLSIDRASGDIAYERTDRGWLAYFNDLHKGRNTGAVWSGFIDVFAGVCLMFCITGLFLLYLHARQRRMTWPCVVLGVVIPLILALIFIH